MSPAPAIPARLTVAELAEAIGVTVEQVQAVLTARHELAAADELIGPELSSMVAEALGSHVTVEPRDLALETLFAMETRADSDIPELPSRVLRLVRGVSAHREELDREIEEASEHWSVARMPIIDRTILRLGLYELKYQPETPTAVIVSEAVRIAKTYSTGRSGSFVNGVLATLARAVRT